jgi:hypothetical protein
MASPPFFWAMAGAPIADAATVAPATVVWNRRRVSMAFSPFPMAADCRAPVSKA